MPLRERSVDLNDVATTGSRLGIETKDLPASVSVVTQELIQLTGARTALEAVEFAVGMTGSVGVGSIPSYTTRGFSGNDVTIMRDGIRQNTGSQSSRPLDAFLFERIEVLKGPASCSTAKVRSVARSTTSRRQRRASSRVRPTRAPARGIPTAPAWASGVLPVSTTSTSASTPRTTRATATSTAASFEYDAFAGDVRWELSDRTRSVVQRNAAHGRHDELLRHPAASTTPSSTRTACSP